VRRIILLLTIALTLFIPSVGCYAHGPWRGKVIESDTKKPIENAVVVAVWYSKLFYPWAVGGTSPEPMKVVETVTNANGEFYFSSKYFIDLAILREVNGPDILIYKPGYDVSGARSDLKYSINKNPIYKNELAIFEFPRLEKKEERLKAWDSASGFRLDIKRKTPLLKKYINQERKYLGFTGEEL
jgi:hypothetical protein